LFRPLLSPPGLDREQTVFSPTKLGEK